MSSLATRSKVFRYASIKQLKPSTFRLPSLPAPSSTSSSIASSAIFFATPHGSKGSLAVLPIDYTQWKRTDNPTTLSVTGGEINDFQFNPFNDYQIVTGANDGYVKLWTIPQGGLPTSGTTVAPDWKSPTSFDNVSCIKLHPTVNGLLAVGHKSGVSVIDLESQEQAFSFGVEGNAKDIVNIAWSRHGEVMSTLGKNSTVALFDPRQAPSDVISAKTYTSPQIKKTHQVLFTGSGSLSSASSSLVLFGLSSSQRPVAHFFDPRSTLSTPFFTLDFDFSNGFVLPLYDVDTNLLFTTVRGSSVISVHEIEQTGATKVSAAPVHSSATESNGIKGMTLINKRGVTTADAEIDRLLLLSDIDIQSYSVVVPRKLTGVFHEELYPPTQDIRCPSNSITSYQKGEEVLPVLISMIDIHENGGVLGLASKGGAEAVAQEKEKAKKEAEKQAEIAKSQPQVFVAPVVHGYARRESDDQAGKKAAANVNESKNYAASETRKQIESKLKKSIYVHTSLKEPPTVHETYYDLKLGASLPLVDNVRCNSLRFAVPWTSLGGSAVAVFELGKVGRAPTTQPCIRGHKSQATCFDLSTRIGQEEWLATGSQEGQIKVWKLPKDGVKSDLNDEWMSLTCAGVVKLVRWHPFIDSLLVSSSSGFDGHLIEFWDLSSSSSSSSSSSPAPALLLNLHPDSILDFSFHPSSHLLATSCKDGKIRIINIASQSIIHEFVPPESVRDTRVLFIDGGKKLITTGFGAGSSRSATMWDAEKVQKLVTIELDRVNNVPIPRYDEDTQLLFIAYHGSTTIQLFDTRSNQLELLTSYTTGADCTGFIFLPKHIINIEKVEIIKALKMTKDAVQEYSFTVPRKRLEFFQDDIYCETRDWKESVMPVKDLLGGKYGADGKAGKKVSLNVKKLPLLSEAPEEELTDRQKRYQQHLAQSAQPKSKGVLGHESAEEVRDHFKNIASAMPIGNRWDAKQEKKSEVADDEWD